jgi:hypothetical protein
MNECELLNTINSLYSQRKQLQNIQTSTNSEEVEKQLSDINNKIDLYMVELSQFSNEILPSKINVEFG